MLPYDDGSAPVCNVEDGAQLRTKGIYLASWEKNLIAGLARLFLLFRVEGLLHGSGRHLVRHQGQRPSRGKALHLAC